MSAWGNDSVRKWSIRIAAMFAAVATGGLLVAWLGLYNIAASKGHWGVTRALLEFGMRNSVATWSSMIDERPLDDPDLVRLGASHFQSGCAPCHGAPGDPANPIAKSMLPPPPSLITHVPTWRNRELFWIVKHGIKYAGMPAWTTQKRNDEVWAIVAFLAALPNLSSRDYRRLAYGEVDRPDASVEQFLSTGLIVPQIGACAKCHGDSETGPDSKLVPRLAGQNEAYLVNALADYAAGLRPSGIMQPVAATLDERMRRGLARYYATLKQPVIRQKQPPSQIRQAGKTIATQGIPERRVPACGSCHGPEGSGDFPRLAGQSARYLTAQLELLRDGIRSGTPRSDVMASIARRMNKTDIAQASSYFASLEPFGTSLHKRDGASVATESRP